MGFSASAPTGQTGVGSATTQSANMPAPTGGKGGGFGTPTQTGFGMQQPQPQRYQPMGGNVYGYNMQRLARQMDPSATLPQQRDVYTAPYFDGYGYNAPSYGGKGGGMGGYGPQAPQFFGYNPFVAPMLQATAQPVTPAPAPASGGGDSYNDAALRQQITDLQNQIRGLTPAATPAPSTVANLYQQYLGRAPESAEAEQYWKQRFGETIDPSEVQDFINAANIEKSKQGQPGTPAPAPSTVQPTTIEGLYRQYLNRDPESRDVVEGYRQQYGPTLEQNEIEDFIRRANVERAQRGMGAVPGYDFGETNYGISERRGAVTPLTDAEPAEEKEQNSGSPFFDAIQSAASSVSSPPPAPAPAPAPAPSSVAGLYQQFLGRPPENEAVARQWQQAFGDTIDAREVEQFKAEANKERAARGLAPMKKGGAVKKTKVQHKGMSNNLKKMLGK